MQGNDDISVVSASEGTNIEAAASQGAWGGVDKITFELRVGK